MAEDSSCPRKTAISIQTIPVFVISLPDCTERRETIAHALHALGLPFEFVEAVDGRYGLDPQYEAQIDRAATRRAGRILSDAEFACSLSHITIYRRIVSENLAYALILEEDAIPYPQLVEFLTGRHYQDADLTQLYGSRAFVRRHGAKRLLGAYMSHLVMPHLTAKSTVAYTVSYRAASHFVTHAVPVTSVADWPPCIDALSTASQYRVIFPPLVGHGSAEDGQSIIHPYGRQANKAQRKFLGMYIPPFRRMVESWGRAPYKLLAKRLP